jgi:hypothetical protein
MNDLVNARVNARVNERVWMNVCGWVNEWTNAIKGRAWDGKKEERRMCKPISTNAIKGRARACDHTDIGLHVLLSSFVPQVRRSV